MTKEDIIRMAREAGFADGVPEIVGLEGFARFATLVAEHEREACAKVCDEHAKRNYNWASENADTYHAQAHWAGRIAAAIRARNNQ